MVMPDMPPNCNDIARWIEMLIFINSINAVSCVVSVTREARLPPASKAAPDGKGSDAAEIGWVAW